MQGLYVKISMLRGIALVIGLGIIAGIASGNQIFGIGRDYGQYEMFFDYMRDFGWDGVFNQRFEVGFSLISLLFVYAFSSTNLIYGAFTFIATVVKVSVLRTIGFGCWVGIMFYMTRFFPIHEMTQLRLALGSSFAMLSLVLEERGYRKLALLTIISGVAFHLSVIVLLPCVFIYTDWRTPLFAMLVSLGILVMLLLFKHVLLEFASEFITALAMYEESGYGDTKTNIFSVAILLDMLFVFSNIFYWKWTSPIMKKILTLQVFSFGIFYGLADFPILVFRIRELFALLLVVYVAAVFDAIAPLRLLAITYVGLSSAWFIYLMFFRDPLFTAL